MLTDYELHKQKKLEEGRLAKRKKIARQALLWFPILSGITIIVWGMIYLVSREKPALTNDSAPIEGAIASIALDDQIKGNKDAKAVLVEYSDFQCPACGFYYPILKSLSEEFGDDLAIVYRHFPLPQHKHAKLMAYAAEAAGKQEKFWEMHDLIFDSQKKWTNQRNAEDTVLGYAELLGFDVERFEKNLELQEILEKVDKNYQDGVRAGINSTPTFFLNGEKISNPGSYDEFRNLIINAINKPAA